MAMEWYPAVTSDPACDQIFLTLSFFFSTEMASVYGSSVLAAQALIKEFLPAALEGAVEKLAVVWP